jgi:hypothetical protein
MTSPTPATGNATESHVVGRVDEAAPHEGHRGWRHRGRWVAVGVALVFAAAITLVCVAVASHHHAARHRPLETDGFGWRGVDAKHYRFVRQPHGGTITTTRSRPGQWHEYTVTVFNPAAVPQTVVGLYAPDTPAWRTHLAVSTVDTSVGVDMGNLTYTDPPVTVRARGSRDLRVRFYEPRCLGQDSIIITGIYIRVRVEGDTRIMHLILGPNAEVAHGLAITHIKHHC